MRETVYYIELVHFGLALDSKKGCYFERDTRCFNKKRSYKNELFTFIDYCHALL
jgi:hypothetical protein